MPELHARVVAARDLKDVQTFGKQDPYCKVSLGAEKYTTRIDDNGGQAPVWNDKFIFTVHNPYAEQVIIEIWNKNVTDSNLIGKAYIPVSLFLQGTLLDQWFPVHRKKKTRGQINLRGQLTGCAPNGCSSNAGQYVAPPQPAPVAYPAGKTGNTNHASYYPQAVYAEGPTAPNYPSNYPSNQYYPTATAADPSNYPPVHMNTYSAKQPSTAYNGVHGVEGYQGKLNHKGYPGETPNAPYMAPPAAMTAHPGSMYGQPGGGYSQPGGGYGQPGGGYGQPGGGYGQPGGGYGQPGGGYGQPGGGYGQPGNMYTQPGGMYVQPQPNVIYMEKDKKHKKKKKSNTTTIAAAGGIGLAGGMLLGALLDD